MDYKQAKNYKKELEIMIDDASRKLNDFEINELGLIPDHIRDTEEYKSAKDKYDMLFNSLRQFNQWFTKEFKKEYAADRRNRFATN